MEKFMFENQGAYSYLVYEIGEDDIVDSLSLGMITNNKIHGIAQALYTQMDDKKFVKYNISTKVSLEQFFVGAVNRKRLLGVFSSIAAALISAEDYMIDSNSLLLDLKYIFADVSTCEAVLICLPIVDMEKVPTDLGMFFKNIMFTTQFDQTEKCDYVGYILNYLNGTMKFSLVEFKQLVDGLLHPVGQENQVQRTQMTQSQATPVQPQIQTPPPAQRQMKQAPQQVQQIPPMQQMHQATPVQPQIQTPQVNRPQPPVQQISQGNLVQNAPVSNEKEISMLGLLMHYSKENKEVYKAQKERQKELKKEKKVVEPAPSKKEKKNKNKKATASAIQQGSFAVPGAPQQGFAVPGQAVQQQTRQNVSQQQSFAIPGQAAQQTSVQRSLNAVQQQTPVANPVYTPPQQIIQTSANFGETTILGGAGIGETTVLLAAEAFQPTEIKPYLIRAKNNEKIVIDKPVFRIGKEKSYVDYFISDNTAISRSHVNIVSRDGEYFVVDTNSTNHTYVNGRMIQSNVETKIDHNMQLRLANEEFEFRTF